MEPKERSPATGREISSGFVFPLEGLFLHLLASLVSDTDQQVSVLKKLPPPTEENFFCPLHSCSVSAFP